MSTHAPIALFAYKRPEHLRQTLLSLERCDGFEDSPLFIFCDGPRSSQERHLTDQVRQLASRYAGRGELHFSDENKGLANSVTAGVNLLTTRFGRAIVVEDDLQVSPHFLTYLNRALVRYESDPRVMHVSAYMYPIPSSVARQSALFLPTIGSWGWATWKRAWSQYDACPDDWRRAIDEKAVRNEFDLGGAADFSSMLRSQMEGRIDSWVIRWYWTLFKQRGLVLYPPRSLVVNKGFDRTGTHGSRYTARILGTSELPEARDFVLPDRIAIDEEALEEVRVLLRQIFGGRTRRALRNALSYARHLKRRLSI